MSVVRVKAKYQITIPHEVRSRLELQLGELLEAEVQDDKIILIPKKLVDRNRVLSNDSDRVGFSLEI